MAKLNKAEIEALAKHLEDELDRKHNTAYYDSRKKILEWEAEIEKEDKDAIDKIKEYAKSLGYEEGTSYYKKIEPVRIVEPVCPYEESPKVLQVNEHNLKQHIIIQQISAASIEDLISRVEQAIVG